MHKFYSEMTASVNYFNYNSQGVCERKMVSYDQSSMLQALTSTQTQRTPALMHSNTICMIYFHSTTSNNYTALYFLTLTAFSLLN